MLRELRKEKGYSQKKLANSLGLTEATISRYETHKVIPPIPVFNSICDILKLSNKQRMELSKSMSKKE